MWPDEYLCSRAAGTWETYGQSEPVQELISAMVANFLESDRGFPRYRKKAQRSGQG